MEATRHLSLVNLLIETFGGRSHVYRTNLVPHDEGVFLRSPDSYPLLPGIPLHVFLSHSLSPPVEIMPAVRRTCFPSRRNSVINRSILFYNTSKRILLDTKQLYITHKFHQPFLFPWFCTPINLFRIYTATPILSSSDHANIRPSFC